jgi:hypothetical protein
MTRARALGRGRGACSEPRWFLPGPFCIDSETGEGFTGPIGVIHRSRDHISR